MSREVLEKYRSELPLVQDTALFCISHPRSILSIHLLHGRHPDQDPVPKRMTAGVGITDVIFLVI
jgi:hypothetical protein